MSNNLKFALLGALIATVILGSVSASVFFFLRYRSLASIVPTPSPVPTPFAPPVSLIPSPQSSPSPDQISWLPKPTKINKLDIFKEPNPDPNNPSIYRFSEANFYHVANLPNGSKLIDITVPLDAPTPNPAVVRIIQSKSGEITPLINQFIGIEPSDQYSIFKPEIKSFPQTRYAELTTPDVIKINGANYNKGFYTGSFFDALENPVKLTDTEYGQFYSDYSRDSTVPEISYRVHYLRSADNIITAYDLVDPILDDAKSPDVKWHDSSFNNTYFYASVARGCGHPNGATVIPSNLVSTKVESGIYGGNKKVYRITDTTNPFVIYLYNDYKVGREEKTVISLEEFSRQNTHFIYQDDLGDWRAYINSEYGASAECGKPVIYLYPEKDTTVTVKVGADITKSEPAYPVSGWTVLAHKSGQLDYQGQSYSSLFWEGMGHGLYPDISGRGFVVAKKDLVPTIISHLSQLGLNQQETTDFLEFWQSKLPTSAYTRLTWLTTAEMNQLAPLAVSPRPDTAIRVFLDFAPLEKPINLAPQNLSAPARAGFTLVEWGGLLVK